jgi:hypothetical protein
MKRMWSAAIVIVAASAAVRAQSGKEMDKPMMGDKMAMTYTGCVESVNHGGSYVLTHLTEGHQMGIGHSAEMKKDSGTAMKDGPAPSDMHGDHMTPSSLLLARAPDLKKHVGHTITVTGLLSNGSKDDGMKDELDTLTVRSLKVIGKACK